MRLNLATGKSESDEANEDDLTYSFVRSTVDKIFNEYDKDRDGHVDLEEARGVLNDTLRRNKLSEEEFQERFRMIDLNFDGVINKKEMAKFIYDVLTNGHDNKGVTRTLVEKAKDL